MLRLAISLTVALAAAPALGAPGKAPPRPSSASPLSLAAWKGDHERLRALLAAGEDPTAPNYIGFTPWMWSLVAQDFTGFQLLFAKVRDLRNASPITADIFLFTVGMNQPAVVTTLLDRGMSPDARTRDGTSALMIAAGNGLPELVDLLLARGANPNLGDQHGDTPLMNAVRAGSASCVQKLLARGANVSPKDAEGARAMTYAAGREDIQKLLQKAGAAAEAPALIVPVDAQTAVARSQTVLARSAQAWVKEGGCNACHMQPMMLRVAAVARKQGFAFDGPLTAALETSLRKERGPDFAHYAGEAVKTEEGVLVASQYVAGDAAYELSFTLANVVDAGLRRPYDQATVTLLSRMQQPDGSFRIGPERVPMQTSDVTSTALGGRLMKVFGLGAQADKARKFLEASPARNGDEAAYRLLGLRWMDSAPTAVRAAAQTLISRQLPGGGWAQVEGMNPDAYATGLALVALAEGAGMTGADPAYKRGVDYLLRTQQADGSWFVHKRAVPVNKYFDSGFPHGKFQFTSFVGTAWAAMAIMYGEPRRDVASTF